MMRRLAPLFLVLTLLLGALWLGRNPGFLERFPAFERRVDLIVQEVRKELSLPPPLRRTEDGAFGALTRDGVIRSTNLARKTEANLAPLAESPDLNAVARLRMKDMFDYQYFAHESIATGEGAAEVADNVGYDYISVGENIALGRFADDADLVQAWMDSPGHRKNILGPGFTEIGVAVGRGQFEGREVWIGVQIFARPLAACPQPDVSLRTRIDSLKAEMEQLEERARLLKTELEGGKPRSRNEIEAHNRKVDEYNSAVARLNALAEEAKSLVSTYNTQVDRLNACIGGI